jgi:16S rRNA (guanine966-N2)-methyltransferase
MSALQHDLPGARVLDLFAGSGALGLEAMSRGAVHATFVETAAAPLRALQANVEKLGAADAVTFVRTDALRWIETFTEPAFDVAFADPPYDGGAAALLVARFVAAPFARILTIEHRARDVLPLPELARTRRYGDTALTFITAPE